jgi:quercetin dioxygenase-like cupin family protein
MRHRCNGRRPGRNIGWSAVEASSTTKERAMHVVGHHPATRPGPSEWFSGSVWIDQIASAPAPSHLHVASIHFTPGARTAWHAHPLGQVLHILEGVGRAQQRGGPLQELHPGDAVISGAGEWHWHGADPHHFMTHLAIHEADEAGNDAAWGDPVGEAEYLARPVNATDESAAG